MSGYPIAVVVIAAGGATYLIAYIAVLVFTRPRVPKATAHRRKK